MSAPRFSERQPLREQRLDLALSEQAGQPPLARGYLLQQW
jgi:hypothetical protein